MTAVIGWLCYVAAAVIGWLVVAAVLDWTQAVGGVLALIATGFVLRTVPRNLP